MNSDNIYITLTETDSTAEQIEYITIQFMKDLKEVGVDKVDRIAEDRLPEGAKVADPFTIGALAIVVAPVVLPKLIDFIQEWVLRGENRRLKIKTSKGLEIEWTPQKCLSEQEIIGLIKELEQIGKHTKRG